MYSVFHTKNDWENRDVTEINREPAHSQWGAYESTAQALAGEITASANVLSLDGTWKFRYFDQVPAADAYLEKNYPHTIQVPGNWETQGFGYPVYTNSIYPWQDYAPAGDPSVLHPAPGLTVSNPPYIPKENPTALYERTFSLPEAWDGKEIFLQFDGVETSYYLWVNDRPVGYAEDSKLPSSFNVTEFVRPGENTVTLQVMKLATGSYLEDQDYWYLSGIYRSVYLIAKPRLRIADYKVSATKQGDCGIFSADVTLSRVENFALCQVKAAIYDGETLLWEGLAPVRARAEYRQKEQPTANTARLSAVLSGVTFWSPESPALYTAVFTLLDETGAPVDMESCRIGFKTVEVKNGIVYLNGQRLIIKGVNRHEHDPYLGRTMTKEAMVADIKLMKQLHINSVRTCHYPDCREWYDLCDEYGILLICECDLETHGVMGQLTHDPAWATEFLRRAVRMVLTHKNHASVYSWSLGNESGTGANHAAMTGWIKEFDPDRLCQYEAGAPGKNISDVRGMMYAKIPDIMNMLTDPEDIRPVILVEYLYQIHNAGGGMYHFPELLAKYKRFQGGYIWDWRDKALVAKTADGREFFGYGGAFGEPQVDSECPHFMTNNGIVTADLRLKPVALEVKQAYAPLRIEQTSNYLWQYDPHAEKYLARNTNMFTSTAGYEVWASVLENGREIAKEKVALPEIPAGGEITFSYEPTLEHKNDCEYTIVFTVLSGEATQYFEKGAELGFSEFYLASGKRTLAPAPAFTKPYTAQESEGRLLLQNGCLTVEFDTATGQLCRAQKNGVDYLLSGGAGNFDRPYTGVSSRKWGRECLWKEVESLTPRQVLVDYSIDSKGKATVECTVALENSAGKTIFTRTEYRLADQTIAVRTNFDIDRAFFDLPRVGSEWILPAGFEALTYFGAGKNETYCDRRLSAMTAVFDSTVEGEHFPFNPPSENGGHEDTRWLTLADAAGHALTVRGDAPFHFDVHHNTVADYKAAPYEHLLTRRPESYLHLDAAHSGIGSNMGWSTEFSPETRVPAGSYTLGFTLELD